MTVKSNSKKKILLQFAIVIAIAIIANILSARLHTKLDVTNDKKFTLSSNTKKMLASLPYTANIQVMLDGTMPGNYTKLQQGITDILNAISDASKGKVKFVYNNPLNEKMSEEDREKLAKSLREKGIAPMPISNQLEEGVAVEKRFIIPYATISANGKEQSICLLENKYGEDMDGILNYSEAMLEYKFANAIKQLNQNAKIEIAYCVGNGQPLGGSTLDALLTLGEQYDLDTIDINNGIDISPAYKCIIICRPTQAFDERTKFKIDQFVMNGGKVLWFVDPVNCGLDTMASSPTYTALGYDLNLDDVLFKYGCRLNKDLIEDLQCNDIPLTVGMIGNTPDIRNEPWIYFPVHTPTSKHSVVNNLDAVYSRFVSSIDTIKNNDNTKHVLLSSSQYSRNLGTPLSVSFNIVRYKPKTSLYNKKYMPVAICIEGGFSSNFENRMDSDFLSVYQDSLGKKFLNHTAADNKMIVVSDADMMLNDFSEKRGPAELGYYTPTRKLFANKTFLLNCVEYLTDDNNLLASRSKNVQLRLLDKKTIANNRSAIQFLNILLPMAIVVLLGSAYAFFRKRKYTNSLLKTPTS
jgi:ABC-2 type transport system permease protein